MPSVVCFSFRANANLAAQCWPEAYLVDIRPVWHTYGFHVSGSEICAMCTSVAYSRASCLVNKGTASSPTAGLPATPSNCSVSSKYSQSLLFTFHCLYRFLATSVVSFQNKPISYSLLINPSSLFSISAETGEISLTRPIDYESDQHRYLLLVRASEDFESLSSAAEVCAFV